MALCCFLWQKDENVLFIRVFIYCEEMEKEGQRPSSQTVPGKEKKQGKRPDFFWSLTEDANGCTGWSVCLLYLLKRKNSWLDFFPLSRNLTSSKLLCFLLTFTRSPMFHNSLFYSSNPSSSYLLLSFWSYTVPFHGTSQNV